MENKKKKIYQIYLYNQYFEYSTRREFGHFEDYDAAYNSMMNGFTKLFNITKDSIFANGSNQWMNDEHQIGIMIHEVSLNEFGEI